ncbi:hypothetical protein ONZ51_g8390 [Trametes cubensis]|uniref:Uncharacterized protein n=1 Tax=Trametes cubensis TaxID=1111947 RepID=A0AAD7TNB0_9APHY|nr:hypothetical protein ONZ51_g8390 [Trametes cubensis]
MPRPDAVVAGLQALLDNLSNLDEVFFQANMYRATRAIHFGSGGSIMLRKLGFTAGPFSNIPFEIEISHPNLGRAGCSLSIYVRYPSTGNTGTNQKAFANAVEYLLSTEDTIKNRDVDARYFEST